MESITAFIPIDRRQALARGEILPERTHGAVLFADISGYTPLTKALLDEFGPRQGADELTRRINHIFAALIAEVHRYGGSVTGFGGDALTCWFDGDPGLRATACALAMQQVMPAVAHLRTPAGKQFNLSIKIAVTVGPVRRFQVGNPAIQCFDVLAGATIAHMALAEKAAREAEVVVGAEVIARTGQVLQVAEWRAGAGPDQRFAVVVGLEPTVEVVPQPWPEDGPLRLSEAQARSWLLPPVYERWQHGQGLFLADIRPVVALFLKFSGLDYDQDDQARPKLDRYIGWVQQVLAQYGGYLIKLTIGDKGSYLFATFGAPLTHDDDASRAVAAALKLRLSPVEFTFIEAVQIGISQGRMLAGAFGSPQRCAYDLLGDEANMAARLMTKAQAGQILASQRVVTSAVQGYDFDYLGSLEIKGKAERLPVFEAIKARPAPFPTLTTPLVGRDEELAHMAHLLAAVQAGHGQILHLAGEAGVGKSHLVAEFIKQAISSGFRVAWSAGESTNQGTLYYAWQPIFHQLLGLAAKTTPTKDDNTALAGWLAEIETKVGQINPAWLPRWPLLGDLLDLPIPDTPMTAAYQPQLRHEALLALAQDIINHQARQSPLLLVIEDIHWLDEASVGLTQSVGRSIRDVPVCLVMVQRSANGHEADRLADLKEWPHYQHLSLQELAETGIASLVSHYLPGQVTPLALSLLQAQAHGNPFYLTELIRTLRQAGQLVYQPYQATWSLSKDLTNTLRRANCLVREPASGAWRLASWASLSTIDLGIPNTIHRLVLARCNRLSEPLWLTLKTASVIGQVFSLPLLRQSHPLSPDSDILLDYLNGLAEQELVRLEAGLADQTYAFKHHLFQEVIYETLLTDQRRALHQAVGETLEQLQPRAVERLAYHFQHTHLDGKTLFYLDLAAQKTQREYANEAALLYYNQALALAEKLGQANEARRRGQLEVLHVLGQREAEKEALQTLVAAAAAPQLELAYLQARYYEAIGAYHQAHMTIEPALQADSAQPDRLAEARCLMLLGLMARKQGHYDQAKGWYERVLSLFHQQVAAPDEMARALSGLGLVHVQQTQYEAAQACYGQALQFSRLNNNRLAETQALNNLGLVAYYQRDFSEATRLFREVLAIQRTIGNHAGEGATLANLGMVIRDAGDYSQALAYLSEALTIQRATGNRWAEGNAWNDLGIIYLLVGDWLSAQACFQHGLSLSRVIDDQAGQAYLLCNLGQLERDRGDLAAAERYLVGSLSQAQAQADKYLEAMGLSHLATVQLQTSQFKQAINLAEAALNLRRAHHLELLTTIDLTTLALAWLRLEQVEPALAYARQARQILAACAGVGPEFPHHDYFRCYQVFQAAGYLEEAQATLQAAYDQLMRQANKITEPAIRQSFLAIPIHQAIVAAAGHDFDIVTA